MKTFKDNAGRTWSISVNVASIERVKGIADIDLYAILDPESDVLEKLQHPKTLCDVLFAFCKTQADGEGISDIAFGEAMAGDAIEDATNALLSEIVDFFPKGRRQLLQKAFDKLQALEQKAIQFGMDSLDDPRIDAEMDELLRKLSTNSQELLGSTQGH